MKELFEIKDSLANKISYYHLMLLMASLPFDRFYSHLILGSFAIHTLIQLKKDDLKRVFKWQTLLLQSVFVITVLGTIYSPDRPEAFNEWSRQITILIVPLFIGLNGLDLKKYKPQLLLAFMLVCTATVIYLYADAFITIKHYGVPLKAIFTGAFTNHNFSQPIDMHATFFSMQLTVSLIYALSVLVKEQSFYNKLLYSICALILMAGLIQLCSKSVFVVIMLVVNIVLPWFLLQNKKRLKYMVISSAVSLVTIAGVLYSGTFRDRFVNELKLDLSKASKTEVFDGRLARWNVVMDLIKKRPVTGYGSGSEIALLQDGFFSHKLYNSYLNRLNAHNQYLSFLLKTGIGGLLIYLLTLAFGFKVALKNKDLLFFSFMMLVAVVGLSENLLDVDKGVFFYAFFFSFFFFASPSDSAGTLMVNNNEPNSDKIGTVEEAHALLLSVN